MKCYIFGISINPKISLPHGCRSIGFATEHTWFGEFLLLIGRIVAAISFLSHSGSGIDSISSPGTFGNLPSFHSRLFNAAINVLNERLSRPKREPTASHGAFAARSAASAHALARAEKAVETDTELRKRPMHDSTDLPVPERTGIRGDSATLFVSLGPVTR